MNKREEQGLSNAVMNYLAIKRIPHYRTRTSGSIIHKRGGGIAYGRDRYAATQRGFPVLLVFKDGRTFALELKSQIGKLSPEQKAWLDNLRNEGCIARVIRSLDEVIALFP